MRYLTWRQFFERCSKLDPTNEQLDEPMLFTIQNGHGDQVAYPVHVWTESIHPSDGTSSLCLNGEELEMLLPGEYERDEEEKKEERAEGGPVDDEPDTRKFLRKLPLGGLRLGFSSMDEDFEEATRWLGEKNPHAKPGPAPLFS